MARLLVDLSPLRTSRQYRLLFSGQAISYVGTQLTAVSTPAFFSSSTSCLLSLPGTVIFTIFGSPLAIA